MSSPLAAFLASISLGAAAKRSDPTFGHLTVFRHGGGVSPVGWHIPRPMTIGFHSPGR